MNKAGLQEISKKLKRKGCILDRLTVAYCRSDGEGEPSSVHEMYTKNFLALEDDDMDTYLKLLKGVLSGTVGNTLYDIPVLYDADGRNAQDELLKAVKDDSAREAFVEKAAELYGTSESFAVLATRGIYDVPVKTSDGKKQEDAPTETYEFMIAAVVPVELVREGLVFDGKLGEFHHKLDDFAMTKPSVGFLYPAFNERSSDVGDMLYFAKKDDERHDEFAEYFSGSVLPRTGKEDQAIFQKITEKAFGRDCGFEQVKDVAGSIGNIADAARGDNGGDGRLDMKTLSKIYRENGADDEAISRLEDAYKEEIGDGEPVFAGNVAGQKDVSVKSESVDMKIGRDASAFISTRVIDGREYILIPIADGLTVNGVPVLQKKK